MSRYYIIQIRKYPWHVLVYLLKILDLWISSYSVRIPTSAVVKQNIYIHLRHGYISTSISTNKSTDPPLTSHVKIIWQIKFGCDVLTRYKEIHRGNSTTEYPSASSSSPIHYNNKRLFYSLVNGKKGFGTDLPVGNAAGV